MNRADSKKNNNIDAINNLNKNYKQFTFDFISKRKIFLAIVGIVFLTGMISFFVRGFNWDIDFVGGTVLEYNIGKDLETSDITEIENLVKETIGADLYSSAVRSGNPPQQIVIKTKEINTDQRNAVFVALAAKYDLTEKDIYRSNNVNPTVGDALTRSTIIAVLLAVALMLVYITFRFDFRSGLAAVLCLIFDMFVMLTFYSLLQISMNMEVIAAFLTILGYSINATIIIFDRVRENVKLKKGTGTKFSEIVNMSASQTFARSLNTTITTLITITCVFIMGVPSIRNFVMPLMVGIVSGLFSSLCLSGNLWNIFKGEKETAVK